jgi:hypothetical protein
MDMYERPASASTGPNIDLEYMEDLSLAIDQVDNRTSIDSRRAEEPCEETKDQDPDQPNLIRANTSIKNPTSPTPAGALNSTTLVSEPTTSFGSNAEVPATDDPGLRETRPLIEPKHNGSSSPEAST